MTLGQQKAKVNEALTFQMRCFGFELTPEQEATLTMVSDHLTDSTHQATVEEIIKIAESLRGNESDGYYSQAIDDLIKAIKK